MKRTPQFPHLIYRDFTKSLYSRVCSNSWSSLIPRPLKEESWLSEAVERMVRSGLSLRQATMEMSIPASSADCETIQRRKSFQQLLWQTRLRYFTELGSDPLRTKQAAIGKLELAFQSLMEAGEFDKAAEVQFKIAKMEGWVGPEQQISVLGELTAKELEEAKTKLLEREAKAVLAKPN